MTQRARAPGARGHGFGLRPKHYGELLERGCGVPLVEAISENFLARGGRPRAVLERVRRDADVVLHGVSLSIGGTDPLRLDYVRELRALMQEIDAAWVSDHLCFSSYAGHFAHDLLPLPYTEETLTHVADRVLRVQDVLGERLLLENVSSYVAYSASQMSEWEFLGAVAERADCWLLLDLNNVHVNSRNHGFDAMEFVRALPRARIRQLHLGGHLDLGTHLLDNHGACVPDPVWDLFREVVALFGRVPTIIEWDENVPSLDELRAEASSAGCIENETLAALTRAWEPRSTEAFNWAAEA